ncbi:NAD(P)/FAD-dependent oxidoreductase [Rhodococcus sp. ABRD24]|uniref:phytoene desaturase family protein n=1 Tax=Rhodococcus sp. ABRD24 TaxID=2507582 RepID=UPI00103A0A77|nr:NAD(P)/FAD-dependent oxidoreductase [Rhodococcus sp. ABRD24]QBJ95585.1 NAD(P)/FAD-dependent oxidoreductase [Rhodococcus sp. ABRD24]
MGYEKEYDGIIVGAGHNGLIAQAYLARAGLRTLSIDKGQHAGGGLQTPEDTSLPGFFHGTHAVSLKGISSTAWFKDLELAEWGVKLVAPDPSITSIQRDGRAIVWYASAERTAESIAQFSERDAHAWKTIAAEYEDVVRELVGPEMSSPAVSLDERDRILQGSDLGRRYLKSAPLSPRQFIEDTFESDAVKAMLLYYCIIREVDVNVRDQGNIVPTFIGSRQPGELAVGGSYSLARALKHDVYAHGGHIMEQTTPRRIVVENGRAVGVELEDGTLIRARRFVASSLNPHQTFLELLGDKSTEELTQKTNDFKYQKVGQIFGVNIALKDAPDYSAAAANPDINKARLTFLGLDDPADVLRLYANADRGIVSDQVMLIGGCPTVADPTQAPPGHNSAYMWQKAPYAIDGDAKNWDKRKAQQLETVLEFWQRYAPNVGGANLLGAFATTPLDTERRFPSMQRGDLYHGWLGPGQRGVDRPFPGMRGHAVPGIDGLYLAGSSAYPGGNITGFPGYLAATQIADEVGVDRWWNPRNLWDELDPERN